jgi:hypothetical protein
MAPITVFLGADVTLKALAYTTAIERTKNEWGRVEKPKALSRMQSPLAGLMKPKLQRSYGSVVLCLMVNEAAGRLMAVLVLRIL